MAQALVTLQKSTGSVLSSTLHVATARQIVAKGDATVLTPGTTGFDVVKLKNATLDTSYQNATSNSPIKLGIDNIAFKPLLYPEVASGF